jgi:hypothetical protein
MDEKFCEYIKKFNEVKSEFNEFSNGITEHGRLLAEVVKYSNILLTSIGRLSSSNVDMVECQGGYNKQWIISTPSRGIRYRYDWSKHSREMNSHGLITVFVPDKVRDWIKIHRSDKLSQFELIRDSFLAGYKDGFIKDYEYNDKEKLVSVDRPVNYSIDYVDDGGEIENHMVKRVSVEFSINSDNSRVVYYTNRKDSLVFGWDWHNFIGASCMLDDVHQLIQEAVVKASQLAKERIDWFNSYKNATSKLASIINL